jgi:uncharacterized protein (TIGR02145 family)
MKHITKILLMSNLITVSIFLLLIVVLKSCKKCDSSLPILNTYAATLITSTCATLNGTINPRGSNAIASFEIGTTADYGKIVEGPASGSYSGAHISMPIASIVTGLNQGTIYHYKIVGASSCDVIYGKDTTFTTLGSGESGIIFSSQLSYSLIEDIDGNVYKTITIGNQEWMAENLRTTKYNDGTNINLVAPYDVTWLKLTTQGFCWYINNPSYYKNLIGALYNWYAVNTNKLCPTGWHVPTDIEWTTLTNFAGGEAYAGGKLKEIGQTHWMTPNTGATNETGFTALPAGNRTNNGSFTSLGYYGYLREGSWWSSTQSSSSEAWLRTIVYDNKAILTKSFNKNYGLSIRCLKN